MLTQQQQQQPQEPQEPPPIPPEFGGPIQQNKQKLGTGTGGPMGFDQSFGQRFMGAGQRLGESCGRLGEGIGSQFKGIGQNLMNKFRSIPVTSWKSGDSGPSGSGGIEGTGGVGGDWRSPKHGQSWSPGSHMPDISEEVGNFSNPEWEEADRTKDYFF